MPEPAGQAPVAPEPVTPAPSPAPAPSTSSIAFDRNTHVPQDLRAEKFFDSFQGKSLHDVVKAGLEAHKAIGSRIPLPGEKDAPEVAAKKREEIYTKLGRPAKADEYKVQVNVPEYIGVDEKFDAGLKSTAHKLGLNNEQVQGLYDFYATYLTEIVPPPGQVAAEGKRVLETQWGAAYTRNYGVAMAAVQKLGGDALVKKFEKAGIADDPELVSMFYEIGKELQESGIIDPKVSGVREQSDIKAELDKIMRDKEDLYHKKGPGHMERVEYVNGLYQQLVG